MDNKVYTIPECVQEVIFEIEAMKFGAREPNLGHAQRALFLLDSLAEWARANVTDKPAAPENDKEE